MSKFKPLYLKLIIWGMSRTKKNSTAAISKLLLLRLLKKNSRLFNSIPTFFPVTRSIHSWKISTQNRAIYTTTRLKSLRHQMRELQDFWHCTNQQLDPIYQIIKWQLNVTSQSPPPTYFNVQVWRHAHFHEFFQISRNFVTNQFG